MSQRELTGKRDPTYSRWHRSHSIERFTDSFEQAVSLGMIDLDHVGFIEYHNATREPILLVEAARDSGGHKTGTVLARLGEKARIPAICVQYTPSEHPNPAYPDVPDIDSFRVRILWHWDEFRIQNEPVEMSPESYTQWLLRLRDGEIRDRFKRGAIEEIVKLVAALDFNDRRRLVKQLERARIRLPRGVS